MTVDQFFILREKEGNCTFETFIHVVSIITAHPIKIYVYNAMIEHY